MNKPAETAASVGDTMRKQEARIKELKSAMTKLAGTKSVQNYIKLQKALKRYGVNWSPKV